MSNKNYMSKPRTALLIGLFTLLSFGVKAQIYTVGVGGNYTSLYAAFDDINNGGITGDITLQITSNLVEVNPCVLDYSGFGGSYTNILIYPTAPNLSITANLPSDRFITFNGADHVTIDGRVNATGSTQSLKIRNTSTTGSLQSVVFFTNSCTYNRIQYCEISCASGNLIPLQFNGAQDNIGNSNNLIANNTIAGASGAYATTSLGFLSSVAYNVAYNNKNDSIINNKILNVKEYGLLIKPGTSGLYVADNSIYDTLPNFSGARIFKGIMIENDNSGATQGVKIIHNYIGGTAPLCGGLPFTMTSNSKSFTGISVNQNYSAKSIIHDNVIQNIQLNSITGSNGIFTGIYCSGRKSIQNNLIGNLSSTSIQISSVFTNSIARGIYTENGDSTFIINNNIGGITANSADAYMEITTISAYAPSSTRTEIKNNTIGGNNTNSLYINNVSSWTGFLNGILVSISGTAVVENNTIQHLTNLSENGSYSNGIYLLSVGLAQVKNNTIHHLNGGNTIIGIKSKGHPVSGRTITNNVISNLTNSSTSVASQVYGIENRYEFAVGALTLNKNFIHSLSVANASSSATGIIVENASSNPQLINNIISVTSNSGEAYGIKLMSNSGILFQHNTIYLKGDSSRNSKSACLQTNTNVPANITNNIFFNGNSNASGVLKNHFCIDNQSGPNFPIIDYNDYRIVNTSSGGSVGYAASTNYNNLAQWKTYTTQDLNSININPNFANPGGTTPSSYFPLSTVNGSTSLGVNEDYFGSTRAIEFWMGALQSQAVLPLTWKSFNANQKSDQTILEWSTYEEINTAYFDVEKSKDAIHWNVINRVEAAGNSKNETDYTTTDTDIIEGVSYYRIKQVDIDGKYNFSNIEKTIHIIETEISIYPNPCHMQLNISLNNDSENTSIEIYSLEGKLLIKEMLNEMNHKINVESLTKGTYMLRVSNSQKTYTTKFVRQ